MSTNKRILSSLLALAMLAALLLGGAGSAFAQEIKPVTMETSDTDKQLSLIYTKLDGMVQRNSPLTWYYTVCDLDHDGNLEFAAAAQHPQDRSTNLRVWEVSADRTSLSECRLDKDEDESFPDILTDSADTFHDTATDTWYYLLYDNVVISDYEVYTVKTAVDMKSNVIGYDAYAVEHTVVTNGSRSVTHTDINGRSISPEQYNAAGVNAFGGYERSSTNFDWMKTEELGTLIRVIDSYSAFSGVKKAPDTFPVPRPSALNTPATPAPTAAPAATPAPAPAPAPIYLSITKNPTNENRTEGDTAYFVSCANVYESLTWTLVAPNGGEYSVANFRNLFGYSSVSGEYSTTLTLSNVTLDMDSWGAYCTFYYQGQTARTSTAYVYVSKAQSHVAPSGTYVGYVTDWNYSSVSLLVEGTVNVTIPWDLCDVDGDIYSGARASVTWNGSQITYCYIAGITPYVGPVYGSMSGTCYLETERMLCIFLNDGTTVYYATGSNCNVYGGSISDIGYAGGGASCVVYYMNYPSAENIYQVDVYVEQRYDQGGWAGSNYYDDYSDYNYYNDYSYYDEPVDLLGGGWAGSNYYSDYEDIGGWAGSNYYSDYEEIPYGGGWAGMHYYG